MNIDKILGDYIDARKKVLKAVNRPDSCRDPLSELSEYIAEKVLKGKRVASRVQKGFDLKRDNGTKVQVKYLANPQKWVNEHEVKFPQGVDEYAIVIIEGLIPKTLINFEKKKIGDVYEKLKKKHKTDKIDLQFTHSNYKAILSDRAGFKSLGVRVYDLTKKGGK